MKTFFIVLLLSYIVQVVINGLIAYKTLRRGATLREWFDRISEYHFIVWVPVIGFIMQLIALIVLAGKELFKRITNATIK